MRATVIVSGTGNAVEMLNRIAPRTAINIMRSTVHAIAGGVAKDAKKDAPVDDGDLKKAIKSKRERAVRGYLRSTVRVNPSAFYWRFLEYGHGPDGIEHAMFMRAVEKFRRDSDGVFQRQFGKKFEAAMARARKKSK